MISLKIFAAALVGLIGLLGVGCELAFGKGPFSKAQDVLETLGNAPIEHYVEKQEMAVKVQARPAVHEPLSLAAKCEKMKTILLCRSQCGMRKECLATCPQAECPRLREKLEAQLRCLATQDVCPDPLSEMAQKCASVVDKAAVPEAAVKPAVLPVVAKVEEKAAVPVAAVKPELPVVAKVESKVAATLEERPIVAPLVAQMNPEEVLACRLKCRDDAACRAECLAKVSGPAAATQQDWQTKKCEELKPVMECHKSCFHDHDCHVQCPKPSCPHMKAKVEMAIQCHGACAPGDRKCHWSCPKPLRHMARRCMLNDCFKACAAGGNAEECRRTCGSSMDVWGGPHRGHGHWHHGGHHGHDHPHHGHGFHHHPYFPYHPAAGTAGAAGLAESLDAVSSRRADMHA